MLEVAARSAADLLGTHPNMQPFYRKIRAIIAHHELEAYEIFDSHVELGESFFGSTRKVNAVVVQLAKRLCLAP